MEDNIEKFVESATRIVYILIKEYNDINNIKIGDKLIIPELINDQYK